MTNKTPKHSPLPFKVCYGRDDDDVWSIEDAEGNGVVETDAGHYPPKKDTAEFIARAVNSHYQMLSALKNALEDGDELRAMQMIKEAIKLAEKGTES